MLLSISSVDHGYLQHNGLFVKDSDEVIRKLLKFQTVPNPDILDIKSFDIVQHVVRVFEEKEEERKVYLEKEKEWTEKYHSLSDELKEKYQQDKYLDELGHKPNPVELYNGVVIGEDVPNFLTVFLVGKFWQIGISVYFNYTTIPMKVVGYEDTKIEGVKVPIEELDLDGKEHMLFLLRSSM